MIVESFFLTNDGLMFALKENLPTSVMVWAAIKKILTLNLPNVVVKILPGPNWEVDNDVIEVIGETSAEVIVNIIEDISINKFCKVHYKEQIVSPD